MQQNPHLPDDLLVQIFSNLPTKSVGKCRCLSKSWRSRLSAHQFAKLHLTRKTHNEQNIILVAHRTQTIHTITAPFVPNAAVRDLQLPKGNVIGSHHGLVLLVSERREIILVNPVTLQEVIIPPPNVDFDNYRMTRVYGFGYDSRSDDYKIVILTCIEEEFGDMLTTSTVDVYSVKLRDWRRLDNSPYDHHYHIGYDGATVNGTIHWFGYNAISQHLVIAAFDLADEVFREVPIPVSFDYWNLEVTQFYDLGGCLCMVWTLDTYNTDVWIMKEYGVVESWSKFIIRSYGQWIPFRPLCFLGDGKILALTDSMLIVYRVEDGEMEDKISSGYICGLTFTDSLISPANIPWGVGHAGIN